MLKDIKLGFKLLRYGYKLKLNVIMHVFFAVFGIASDIMSKGTTIVGGIYFMMSGMFTFQLIMSMDVSELIQSTSLKKKLQIYIPVMSSTVINLVVFTFLVIERVILIQNSVADKKQLIFTLFTLDVELLTVYLYTSICYKYYVLGFIVFMVLFMGVFTVFSGAAFVPVSNAVFKLGLPVVALLGYIAILAGGAFEILIGELVHVIADAHIYDRHVDAIKELISREPFPAPKFWLNPEIKDFYQFTPDDVKLEGYQTGEQIRDIPIAI